MIHLLGESTTIMKMHNMLARILWPNIAMMAQYCNDVYISILVYLGTYA